MKLCNEQWIKSLPTRKKGDKQLRQLLPRRRVRARKTRKMKKKRRKRKSRFCLSPKT
jgi:hypothetical protein